MFRLHYFFQCTKNNSTLFQKINIYLCKNKKANNKKIKFGEKKKSHKCDMYSENIVFKYCMWINEPDFLPYFRELTF